jgi:ABC-type sugar transport system ATPase subunit
LQLKNCKQAIGSGIAFLTENRRTEGFIPEMGIRENVSMTVLNRLSRWGVINRRKDHDTVKRAFQDFQIVSSGPEQIVKKLSGGNQQKVVLAKWMASDVRFLILDEPTRGVDVGAKAEIYDLIAAMAKEKKIGVLFISSEARKSSGFPTGFW